MSETWKLVINDSFEIETMRIDIDDEMSIVKSISIQLELLTELHSRLYKESKLDLKAVKKIYDVVNNTFCVLHDIDDNLSNKIEELENVTKSKS